MKLTESQLRSIVREEINRLHEATGEVKEAVDANNFDHLEIGNDYKVSGMPGKHQFIGWFDESGEIASIDLPTEKTRLKFLDINDNEEWDAYYFNRYFCWGSSAKKLIVKELTTNNLQKESAYDLNDLAKRAVDVIMIKYTGKIYNTPSGEIENELFSYLESAGLANADLYNAVEQAQERLERIFKISF